MLLRIACLACVMALVVVLLSSATAWGQPAGAGDADSGGLKWFDFFVLKGGSITLVLVALSVVAIALTVEHCYSIRRATIVPPEAARRIQALIDEKEYLEAVQFTADEPSMMGYVLNAGLMESANGYAAMERAVQESLRSAFEQFQTAEKYLWEQMK